MFSIFCEAAIFIVPKHSAESAHTALDQWVNGTRIAPSHITIVARYANRQHIAFIRLSTLRILLQHGIISLSKKCLQNCFCVD